MANAVVMSDPAGNRMIAKERATGRVDGAIAGVMAIGCSMKNEEQTECGMEVW